MAVQVTGTPIRRNVDGMFRENVYNLNITGSGDTYDTKLKKIVTASTPNSGAITNMTFVAGVITFTTTGAVNAVPVSVTGW